MSLEEFLAWEREQPERYEYAASPVPMMTGAPRGHVAITANVGFALRQALKGTGCQPFANDAKVIAATAVRYPDIAVTCAPVSDGAEAEPIVEVISPIGKRRSGSQEIRLFSPPSRICNHRRDPHEDTDLDATRWREAGRPAPAS